MSTSTCWRDFFPPDVTVNLHFSLSFPRRYGMEMGIFFVMFKSCMYLKSQAFVEPGSMVVS